MRIESAELVRYNANNRGTSTGDCTARAISLAFNMDYSKAKKVLNQTVQEYNKKHFSYYERKYNNINNVTEVIKLLGGGEMQKPDGKISVGDFADNHTGTYVIWCSDTGKTGGKSHLVCIINDRIYDSWDSRRQYIIGYWIIKNGIKDTDVTDIRSALKEYFDPKMTKDYWNNYTAEVFDSIIGKTKKIKKVADKYGVDITLGVNFTEVTISGYTFTFKYEVELVIPEYDVKEVYKSKFSVVFKPTMTVSDISDYFESTFFGKMYSFVLNVIGKADDICKGAALYKGYDFPKNDIYLWGNYERKAFAGLPYWVRRIAKSFSAESPLHNDYSDRVTLEIYVPPFDTEYDDPNRRASTRYFNAYRLSDLKDALDYYKETGDYARASEMALDY